MLAAGASREEILEDYPLLGRRGHRRRPGPCRNASRSPGAAGRLIVRFLVDAQLPPALAHWLEAKGHEASHVYDLGLLEARDREIWEHAGSAAAAIVTKDEDLVTLLSVSRTGPAAVWVRLGNTTIASPA